jgi:hypothetical protein
MNPSSIVRSSPKARKTRVHKSSSTNKGSRAEAATAARMAKWLTSTVKALREGLFKDGFFILTLPHRFRMKPASVRFATAYVKGDDATCTIFQKNPLKGGRCNDGDGTRHMLVRDDAVKERAAQRAYASQDALVRDLTEFQVDLVRRAFGNKVVGNTASLILSHPAVGSRMAGPQVLHADGNTTVSQAIARAAAVTPTNPVSFSALTSFQGCTVTAIKGSHLEARRMSADEKYTPSETLYGEHVVLKPNQTLFFTQDLIHAGDGYTANNLRFHMYFDHVDVPRLPDATNPLSQLFGTARAKFFQREEVQ